MSVSNYSCYGQFDTRGVLGRILPVLGIKATNVQSDLIIPSNAVWRGLAITEADIRSIMKTNEHTLGSPPKTGKVELRGHYFSSVADVSEKMKI